MVDGNSCARPSSNGSAPVRLDLCAAGRDETKRGAREGSKSTKHDAAGKTTEGDRHLEANNGEAAGGRASGRTNCSKGRRRRDTSSSSRATKANGPGCPSPPHLTLAHDSGSLSFLSVSRFLSFFLSPLLCGCADERLELLDDQTDGMDGGRAARALRTQHSANERRATPHQPAPSPHCTLALNPTRGASLQRL